jgi:SAM-dependent methyltransferase
VADDRGEQLQELLARLARERDEADRRYNDALTALDRSAEPAPEMPHPPPAYDATKLAAVNEAWNILPDGAPAIDGWLKGRLRGLVWRLVGPPIETQRHFNAALVDHLNRNIASHVEAEKAIATAIAVIRQQAEALARFQAYLIQYLQTITLYVDTKDRSIGGQAQVLASGMNAIADDWLKRWESLASREARFAARLAPLSEAYGALEQRVTLAQQNVLMLTKELERRAAPGVPVVPVVPVAPLVPTTDLDAFKYVAFEDQFRGSREDIRDRLRDYLPTFAGCKDVLDVGCGRGELLDLLREQGVAARGIDLNPTMVDVCRERGLDAERADALGYLQSLADGSLGGLVAIQVVEHLEPSYLLRFLNAAFDKLRPGAPMVLETLNPACWVAFFESYIRDITHRWPLHPETLSFLVQASGFRTVDVQWRAPVPEADKLPSVVLPPPPKGAEHDATIVDLAGALNAHAEKLNARMFTYLDYAVVAKR